MHPWRPQARSGSMFVAVEGCCWHLVGGEQPCCWICHVLGSHNQEFHLPVDWEMRERGGCVLQRLERSLSGPASARTEVSQISDCQNLALSVSLVAWRLLILPCKHVSCPPRTQLPPFLWDDLCGFRGNRDISSCCSLWEYLSLTFFFSLWCVVFRIRENGLWFFFNTTLLLCRIDGLLRKDS